MFVSNLLYKSIYTALLLLVFIGHIYAKAFQEIIQINEKAIHFYFLYKK